MTCDDFLNKQLYISMGAGTSQRIHQDLAMRWTAWDRAFKIIVGVLAVVSLCLSVYSVTPNGARWATVAIWVSGLGALAAIALNVLPFGEWASRHNALFQRWSDMREDVDAILYDHRESPSAANIARLKELDSKYHRICSSEPKCSKRFIDRHYAAEKKSRTKVAIC